MHTSSLPPPGARNSAASARDEPPPALCWSPPIPKSRHGRALKHLGAVEPAHALDVLSAAAPEGVYTHGKCRMPSLCVRSASSGGPEAWRFDPMTLKWTTGDALDTSTDLAEVLPGVMAEPRLHTLPNSSAASDAVLPCLEDAIWMCIGRVDFSAATATADHCFVLFVPPSPDGERLPTDVYHEDCGHVVLVPLGNDFRGGVDDAHMRIISALRSKAERAKNAHGFCMPFTPLLGSNRKYASTKTLTPANGKPRSSFLDMLSRVPGRIN
jgi:hypothetical protein